MQIVRMQNEVSRAGHGGSVQEMASKHHSRAVWFDSPDQHVTHRTDGDGLDQVGGRWSQPVKVEIRVNELMCSADQRSCLDRLGPLSARADMFCCAWAAESALMRRERGASHGNGVDCRFSIAGCRLRFQQALGPHTCRELMRTLLLVGTSKTYVD